MRIILTTDVIHAGGAETFILRLAQALLQRGHNVFLFILYKDKIDYKLIKAVAPDVNITPANLHFTRPFQIADGLLRRLKIDFSLVDTFLVRELKRCIRKNKIEIIHSHLFTADIIAVKATENSRVPVVTTIHGDYKNYSRKVSEGLPMLFLNYHKKLKFLLSRLAAIVYISEEQLQFFKEQSTCPDLHLHKIYNGYQIAAGSGHLAKQDLAIPVNAFVFGMVARGIPEKGWLPVIEAFTKLTDNNSYLVLVGDSSYVQGLKQQYHSNKKIIFAGYSSNPIEYIRLFDVGLFASTYYSESLPTVIIEYLSCNVPVISVDIAECVTMLKADERMAGEIVKLENGKVPVVAFSEAMQTLITNKDRYHQLKQNTPAAFKKFDMNACVEAYESVYAQSI